MGLSSEEHNLFNSIVNGLEEGDTLTVERTVSSSQSRLVILNALLFIAGFAGMFAGVYFKSVFAGVASFSLMVYSFNSLLSLTRFFRHN